MAGFVDGKVGKALRFDGEDWAKHPKVADFDRHQPFSLAFWLQVPAAYDRAVVVHRSKSWTDAGSRGYELLVEDGCLSFALVHFWPGNAIRIRTAQPFPVGRWAHVALTYDGSSGRRPGDLRRRGARGGVGRARPLDADHPGRRRRRADVRAALGDKGLKGGASTSCTCSPAS